MAGEYLRGVELARQLGISRQAVDQAMRKGHLVRRPDCRYDLANPVNQDYVRAATDRRRIKQLRESPRPGVIGERERGLNQAEKLGTPEEITKILGALKRDGKIKINDFQFEGLSRPEAERLKIIEELEDKRIKNQRARQELLDRTLVSRVFQQLYQIDINGFRGLPASVAPLIAAVLQLEEQQAITKIEEIVSQEVFKVLDRVRDVLNKFLLDLKQEPLSREYQ